MARADFSDEKLKRLVQALEELLGERLWAIVLFGSQARGEERSESDWDLLLIADGLPQHPLARLRWLKEQLPSEVRGRISLIAKTRREFEAGFPSYYLDLGLDGAILFDRQDYMESKLARIRSLIEQAGLVRRRLDGGFIWEWKEPPGGLGGSIGAGSMDSKRDAEFRSKLAQGFLQEAEEDHRLSRWRSCLRLSLEA